MKFSLRTKITLSSIFFILIGGLIATYSVFVLTKNSLVEIRKEGLEINNKERVKETELVFRFAENAVKTISENSSVINFLYNNENQSLLEVDMDNIDSDDIEYSNDQGNKIEEIYASDIDLLEKQLVEINLGDMFEIVYLLDPKGNAVVSTDRSLLGNNYSFRDYFIRAKENGHYIDFSVGITTKKAGYYFSREIRKDGQLLGVAVGKMGTDIIEETTNNNIYSSNSNSMFLDEFGVIIHSNKLDRLYKSSGKMKPEREKFILETKRYALDSEIESLGYDFILDFIEKGYEFQIHEFFDVIDGEDEIVTFVKVGDFPFYFVLEVEEKEFLKSAVNASTILAGIVFSSAVLVGFFIFYAILIFLKPLKKLEEGIAKISKRNFSSKVIVKTNDEFGDLAKALNEASEELRRLYDEMEEKVQERTRKFEETNRFMVGREIKMIELKREIAELKNKLDSQNKK